MMAEAGFFSNGSMHLHQAAMAEAGLLKKLGMAASSTEPFRQRFQSLTVTSEMATRNP